MAKGTFLEGLAKHTSSEKEGKDQSAEYAVFLLIAAYGLWSWWKEYKDYQEQNKLERSNLPLVERY